MLTLQSYVLVWNPWIFDSVNRFESILHYVYAALRCQNQFRDDSCNKSHDINDQDPSTITVSSHQLRKAIIDLGVIMNYWLANRTFFQKLNAALTPDDKEFQSPFVWVITFNRQLFCLPRYAVLEPVAFIVSSRFYKVLQNVVRNSSMIGSRRAKTRYWQLLWNRRMMQSWLNAVYQHWFPFKYFCECSDVTRQAAPRNVLNVWSPPFTHLSYPS